MQGHSRRKGELMIVREIGPWFVGIVVLLVGSLDVARGQTAEHDERLLESPFQQLGQMLPTPNAYRTASGAPGHGYWQQQVNYTIDVQLDDKRQMITGHEAIAYTNRSPDRLTYLWVQLDANIFRPDSDAALTSTAPELTRLPYRQMEQILARRTFDGGVTIDGVRGGDDKSWSHTVVKTMMRIDLPHPLDSRETVNFSIDWHYAINNSRLVRGRTGYEYFSDDGNYIYEIAQWFPRLAPYTDATGWQHKQFLGSGEFALEFGDYLVRITVPADHIVAATGTLINVDQVLTTQQRDRLRRARDTDRPVFVVTPAEAKSNETSKPAGEKTWIFRAENVRDFAFASSRKFIWDAQSCDINGRKVLAMSLYPNEGEPLWSKYSTRAIVHTLRVYSRYTFDYPYPVAYSINGPVGGMEYPMICFNGPRPEKDGTYSKRTKYGLISVVIHEVGHNFFPMIVNSDERQWTWMDEGFNTFLQYLSEQEWEADYPSRRGEPQDIVDYMASDSQMPIMTNSESLLQFHSNAYAKPATALNILRESILGRELFDHAFREYALRWKFKHPMPADFFRTMEDASGVDLDWFFRGWFYTTAHVDMAITQIRQLTVDTRNPRIEKARDKREHDEEPKTLSQQRNERLPKLVERLPELKDFYNELRPFEATPEDEAAYRKLLELLSESERAQLQSKKLFYVVEIDNIGGLVMPVILAIEFADGSTQELRIPAEIWRRNDEHVSKLLVTDKPIKQVELDPHRETADVDLANNMFPRQIVKSRFQLFKEKKERNEMQKQKKTAR